MIKTQPDFAEHINNVPQSFIREILKVADAKNMISFAGGLPNPAFFPVKAIADACEKVLTKDGNALLQYSVTEGYMPLREYLADRQEKKSGIKTSPEQILMLNGSQQGIDLTGKTFLNHYDTVLLEAPSYLGAIQSFSALGANMLSVKMEDSGVVLADLKEKLGQQTKLFYSVPSYQNPTGTTYSLEKRAAVADLIQKTGSILLEDNPYGEIYFDENPFPDIYNYAPGNTVLLGSFSKMVSPGIRLGWAVADERIIRKMAVCKQAIDLHTSIFSQRVLYQYLMDNNLDDHLKGIRDFYKTQRDWMLQMIKKYFPDNVSCLIPKGGMFVWCTLPENLNASKILEKAIERGVIFVPGSSFYLDGEQKHNTLRINFSNPAKAEIETGIKILGSIIRESI